MKALLSLSLSAFFSGFLLLGCVTTHTKNGVPYEPSPEAVATAGKAPQPAEGLSKPKVELLPRSSSPDLYDYKVLSMEPGSPFVKAGIKPNDIIVSIDGRSVGTMGEILKVTSTIDSGAYSQIVVRRGGKNFLLKARK